MLDILIRVYETHDRNELIEIAEQYSLFDVAHLDNNQIRNILSLKLSPVIEG